MINPGNTFREIIADGGNYEWQIVNGSNTFTKDNLITGTITSTICNGVAIGNVLASQLDLTVRDVTYDTSSSLVVQFRAVLGDRISDWVQKGVYYFDSIEVSRYSGIAKIVAFDAILKTRYIYQKSGTWTPSTDYNIVVNICNAIGVELNGNTAFLLQMSPKTLTASPKIGKEGTTAMEMLSYIGIMRGGNWFINNYGQLILMVLTSTPLSTADIGNAVVDFDAAPPETVKKVKIWQDKSSFFAMPEIALETHNGEEILAVDHEPILVRATDDIESWSDLGGYCIEAELPFYASQEVTEEIYNQFRNQTFYPFESQKAYVPPQYEVGDGIEVKDVTSFIANQILTLNALAPSSVSLDKEDMLNSLYPYIKE